VLETHGKTQSSPARNLPATPIQNQHAKGAPGLAFETWDPPSESQSSPARNLSPTPIQNQHEEGAPGLAFETWDPPSKSQLIPPPIHSAKSADASPPALPPELRDPRSARASSHLPRGVPRPYRDSLPCRDASRVRIHTTPNPAEFP
jgi:hypothetical protein